MTTILKCDFQKKKTITFFRSKLCKFHKKDPILHVTTTFFLKSSGPIPPPLRYPIHYSYQIEQSTLTDLDADTFQHFMYKTRHV